MEGHLSKITGLIETYNELSSPNAKDISDLHRMLTSELFFLVSHRDHFHTLHNRHILESSLSVARATVEANDKYPQLYLIRNVMRWADGTVQAMRSSISTLNKER